MIFEIVLPDLIENWRLKRKFIAGQGWRSDRDVIKWLRGMTPAEFEEYIAQMFTQLGCKAEAVGKSHDGGIDVVIEKDGEKGYVQCKKYSTSTVGVSEVRDFYGALVDNLSHSQGYFITTNKFTLEAKRFAEDKPIELIDSFSLLKYIKLAYGEDVQPAETVKVCPRCGNELVKRNGRRGGFLGCSTYPNCIYTESLSSK